MFFRRLHSDYRHGTWSMFSKNYKILKFTVQSQQELTSLTSVKKYLSPKTLIGPGKLPGFSRNGPLAMFWRATYTLDAKYILAINLDH